MRRSVDRVEFAAEAPRAVLWAMDRLTGALDGWINFLPGLAEGAEVDAEGPGLFPMLSPRHPGVTMGTWFPPRGGRRPRAEQVVGVTHSAGAKVVAGLTEAGLGLPADWRVVQDHPRRGLIVAAPGHAPHDRVLDYTLSVTATLCVLPLTGTWQAEIHQPLVPGGRPAPEP